MTGVRLSADAPKAAHPSIAPPGAPPSLDSWTTRKPSGKPTKPARPTGPRQDVDAGDGRHIGLAFDPDGRVAFSAPPPPIREITFAGGGGKGAALPGVVRALEESGALKGISSVHGASVGSMTASLVAAGCTADEFQAIADDPAIAPGIMEGKSMPEILFGGKITGEGLETMLRGKLDRTLQKHVGNYLNDCINEHREPDEGAVAILEKLADGTKGPTFMDLRLLSRVVADVKEVTISATYMAEIDSATGEPVPNDKPQLAIFSADTQPQMEIALAVRASAALPPVFKPVDIKLASGITARFQDGGVLNNVPSTDSLGTERKLDPMPEKGSVSFVFESDAANEAAQGKATPSKSRFKDLITGAENSAADYATFRDLADRPEDMVVVPLRVKVPKKDGNSEDKDFSGMLKGTLNFDMAPEDRMALQTASEQATASALMAREQPKTQIFNSAGEMLNSISRKDLEALAKADVEGAKDTLKFRDDATAAIAGLAKLAKSGGKGAAELAKDAAVKTAFAELDKLVGADRDRQAFVGRELNRDPALDGLLKAAKDATPSPGPSLAAGGTVAEAVAAQAHAKTILRDAIYPQLVDEKPKSAAGLVLKQVDDRLRKAATVQDVNDALDIAIAHYRGRFDAGGLRGFGKFADRLETYKMK